jgi:hypothetical protein
MRIGIFALALLLAPCAIAQSAPPSDIPQSLQPPAGQTMILQAHAIGKQIYTCSADAGKFSWTLKGPDAELRDPDGHVIISHSAGPKWQHRDGSFVTGKVVAKQDAPQAGAVQWLLLSADNSRSAAGVLSHVTFVQRIHTDGGQPPATGCDEAHKGDETKSNYTADYLFYAPTH